MLKKGNNKELVLKTTMLMLKIINKLTQIIPFNNNLIVLMIRSDKWYLSVQLVVKSIWKFQIFSIYLI